MKKLLVALVAVVLSGSVVAGPSTFVEGALIDGGENGRNGASDQFGYEAVGGVALGDKWYVGGVLGRFNRDSSSGDITNTYLNLHGGHVFSVREQTDLFAEVGLWFGNQDQFPTDTDPRAFEIKAGVSQSLSEKLAVFGTLAWVNGDLDTMTDSNLRNYVWSLGAAYSFNEHASLNLKMVNGVNGVNGQDQVLRLAFRWTF